MSMGTTLRNDTLVCTSCDEVVTLESGYDGYMAKCGCEYTSFSLSVGSGDKPYSWECAEKLTELKGFKIDGGEWTKEGMVGQTAKCLRCDNEDLDIEFEDVSIGNLKRKATLRCENEHGSTGYVNVDTVYDNMGDYTSDFWK